MKAVACIALALALAACGAKKPGKTTPTPPSGTEEPLQEDDKMRDDSTRDPGDDNAVDASEDPCMGGE